MSLHATIADLRSHLRDTPQAAPSPAYADKMLHTVPKADVVDRVGLILDMVKGKRVLEFGASGPMQPRVQGAASQYYGVDREAKPPHIVGFDLDNTHDDDWPRFWPHPASGPEIIVCGEVLEHLSNPGHFLGMLAHDYRGVPVVITVPNAFSSFAAAALAKGIESVNKDHVAWYSWHTLKVLLERHGYKIASFCWYHGSPLTAEGLIVLAETVDG